MKLSATYRLSTLGRPATVIDPSSQAPTGSLRLNDNYGDIMRSI